MDVNSYLSHDIKLTSSLGKKFAVVSIAIKGMFNKKWMLPFKTDSKKCYKSSV